MSSTREWQQAWRLAHPESIKRSSAKYRNAHKEEISEYYRNWYRLNGRKRKHNYADLIYLWREQNPEKIQATHLLQDAIEQGFIIKPNQCSNCNITSKILAHHEDYLKPLDVVWLCYSCHKKLHNFVS